MTHSVAASTKPAELAVLLPGTGSDEVFVRSVFEVPLAAVGVRALTPGPRPGPRLGESYLDVLDEAAADAPVLAGGISFGAHLAAEWALRNPDRCAGLLLALPAWNGDPGDSPAALAARLGADAVRAGGVETALAALTGSVDPWLAAELGRAWRGYGSGLADSLLVAAGRRAPTVAELSEIRVPVGVAGCVDDLVHPLAVAKLWAGAFAHAHLCTTRLDIVGADPEALGRAAVLAWLRAGGRPVI
ncbi:MAG TPA: alpha/beta hydrolase [Actinophytocola sp.]|uniref:alpha/beta fold hydrolase n=1 Tax=Actinophytocola sp. TaxID=1872138 RepID=UPI002DDD9F05|nr:alpha/beta hydrolase [Actinophytocola sp.]HEV2779122.1 alpha/beta hydrolase [Actinophytocola sp.]